jgi:ATP:ADP antiporter, AAA family
LKKLLQLLNIESGEEGIVFLILIQSFFIGVFNAAFDVTAHALFLNSFNEDSLANAYMISGFAGIIMAAIYSKLQNNIKFSSLILLNIFTIAAITFSIWSGLSSSGSKWIIFGTFVMMGPLNIIALVSFNGMVIRLFTLRQGKRLFGLVDSGLIFGMIVIGFSIQLLLRVMETKDILLVSSASMLIAFVIQFFIGKNYQLGTKTEESTDGKQVNNEESQEASYKTLFTNPYIRTIALFTVITMIGLFFIQFSFLSVTKSKYPEESELAGFLGVFTSALMIFSLIIKTFVYSKLVKIYGLKVSLVILPSIVGLFTVLAVLAGHAFEYENVSFDFVFFFLLISLTRLFSVALKESIQAPSYKLLYQSLDKNIRYDIQAKIDGVVNEVAATFSGIVLVALSFVPFLALIHYSYITIIIAVIWAYLAVKLYQEYRNSLQMSLSKIKTESNQSNEELNNDQSTKVIQPKNYFELSLLKNYNPIHFLHQAQSMIQKNKLLEKNINTAPFKLNNDTSLKRTEIVQLMQSSKTEERIIAAQNLQQNELDEKFRINALTQLAKDTEMSVRIAAMDSISKTEFKQLYHYLIDYLGSDLLKNAAKSCLIRLENKALDLIEQSFYKTSADFEFQKQIIEIFQEVDDEKCLNYLEKKINYPDYKIKILALKALKLKQYKATENAKIKIKNELLDAIKISAWNLAAYHRIKSNEEHSKELADSLKTDVLQSFVIIYELMALLYDAKTIAYIKSNIESGTSESIGFALELLELFIDEDVKPTLFPLIEDINVEDKIVQLEQFFPVKVGESYLDILKNIINRDYNSISSWSKVCAIYDLLGKNNDNEQFIIANLFNIDPLIQETSAFVCYNNNVENFEKTIERLDEETRDIILTNLNKAKTNKKNLLIEKAIHIVNSNYFQQISFDELSTIVKQMSFKTIKENDIIEVENDYWFFIAGNSSLSINNNTSITLKEGDVISSLNIQDKKIKLTTNSEANFYKISEKNMNHILRIHPHISTNLLKIFDYLYPIMINNEQSIEKN